MYLIIKLSISNISLVINKTEVYKEYQIVLRNEDKNC